MLLWDEDVVFLNMPFFGGIRDVCVYLHIRLQNTFFPQVNIVLTIIKSVSYENFSQNDVSCCARALCGELRNAERNRRSVRRAPHGTRSLAGRTLSRETGCRLSLVGKSLAAFFAHGIPRTARKLFCRSGREIYLLYLSRRQRFLCRRVSGKEKGRASCGSFRGKKDAERRNPLQGESDRRRPCGRQAYRGLSRRKVEQMLCQNNPSKRKSFADEHERARISVRICREVNDALRLRKCLSFHILSGKSP